MSQQNQKVSELSRSLRTTGTSAVTINPTSSSASILGSITAATSNTQAQGSASSRPMNISRQTRGTATPNKDGPVLAQSAPLMFRQPPPKAPPARPRLPSIDPPPMTLPPSPPVSVPVQLTAGPAADKDDNSSSGVPVVAAAASKKGYEPSSRNTNVNAAVYSRSLSDYNYMMLSASCPPTNEYLSRIGTKFGAVTEEKSAHKEDDDETDVSDLPEVGGRLARKQSEDGSANSQAHTSSDSSALLSKSPTIFSLLNNKPDIPSALSQSLNTRPAANSAIFGSLGAIRNLHPNAPAANAPGVPSPTSASHSHGLPHSASSSRGPSSHSTTQSASAHLHARAAAAAHPPTHHDDDVNGLSDGLQFSMSLTDEQSVLDDDEQEDTTNSNATTNTNASAEDNVFLPLY